MHVKYKISSMELFGRLCTHWLHGRFLSLSPSFFLFVSHFHLCEWARSFMQSCRHKECTPWFRLNFIWLIYHLKQQKQQQNIGFGQRMILIKFHIPSHTHGECKKMKLPWHTWMSILYNVCRCMRLIPNEWAGCHMAARNSFEKQVYKPAVRTVMKSVLKMLPDTDNRSVRVGCWARILFYG